MCTIHDNLAKFIKKIYLISNISLIFQENQAREKGKLEKRKDDQKEEMKRNKELAKEGKAPVFISKSDRKKKELVEKFEELKGSGKIDKYLKKKAKKNESKDRRRMKNLNSKT